MQFQNSASWSQDPTGPRGEKGAWFTQVRPKGGSRCNGKGGCSKTELRISKDKPASEEFSTQCGTTEPLGHVHFRVYLSEVVNRPGCRGVGAWWHFILGTEHS